MFVPGITEVTGAGRSCFSKEPALALLICVIGGSVLQKTRTATRGRWAAVLVWDKEASLKAMLPASSRAGFVEVA
jgi:hypothetical protein